MAPQEFLAFRAATGDRPTSRPVEVKEISRDSPEIWIARVLVSFVAGAAVLLLLWLFVA